MPTLTINGKTITTPEGSTILEAARHAGIRIPSLCHMEGLECASVCRICMVEVGPQRKLEPACSTMAAEGMEVRTNSTDIREARRTIYELIMSDHGNECLQCTRNQTCELQKLGYELGITENRYEGASSSCRVDVGAAITRDDSKCILCRRCVNVCRNVQKVGAINVQNRGFDTRIGVGSMLPADSGECVMCGQCTLVCPTGALSETDSTADVWRALADNEKRVIVQAAPSLRAALGEEFGMPTGTLVKGRMLTALRELGFDEVFDVGVGGDVNAIEQAEEFVQRLIGSIRNPDAARIPMIATCSPGFVKHMEHRYPGILGNMSTCKSPHTMLGALIKAYYSRTIGEDPNNMYVVSVMPCTAQKYEIKRPEMNSGGICDVDAVLTTRELARMLREAGVDFVNLEEGEYDHLMGDSTGAGSLYGAAGGLMEAVLRTLHEKITGRGAPFDRVFLMAPEDDADVRCAKLRLEGVLPEYAELEGFEINAAVGTGPDAIAELMHDVTQGTSPYHFIEMSECRGGCVDGGGQPRTACADRAKLRRLALMREDEESSCRMAHENQDIRLIYDTFIGSPMSRKAKSLLHTEYTPRGRYNGLLYQL